MRITLTARHLSNHPSVSCSRSSKPQLWISPARRLCLTLFFISRLQLKWSVCLSLPQLSCSPSVLLTPLSYIYRQLDFVPLFFLGLQPNTFVFLRLHQFSTAAEVLFVCSIIRSPCFSLSVLIWWFVNVSQRAVEGSSTGSVLYVRVSRGNQTHNSISDPASQCAHRPVALLLQQVLICLYFNEGWQRDHHPNASLHFAFWSVRSQRSSR